MKPPHEIDTVANTSAQELTTDSPFMKGLQALVWGNNPPLSKTVSKSDALDMYASQMTTPQGRMNMITKFGREQTAKIEQALVKAGRIPAATITPPPEPPQ